jgi:hypothetical protein
MSPTLLPYLAFFANEFHCSYLCIANSTFFNLSFINEEGYWRFTKSAETSFSYFTFFLEKKSNPDMHRDRRQIQADSMRKNSLGESSIWRIGNWKSFQLGRL